MASKWGYSYPYIIVCFKNWHFCFYKFFIVETIKIRKNQPLKYLDVLFSFWVVTSLDIGVIQKVILQKIIYQHCLVYVLGYVIVMISRKCFHMQKVKKYCGNLKTEFIDRKTNWRFILFCLLYRTLYISQ